MGYKNFSIVAAALLISLLTVNANASSAGTGHNFVFNFSGQCDDCAFDTAVGAPAPGEIGFNSIDDGFVEAVTGRLTLTDAEVGQRGQIIGASFIRFAYDGSNLINPFVLDRQTSFVGVLSPSGNAPAPFPFSFDLFRNNDTPLGFCTDTGVNVLGARLCENVSLVRFLLEPDGSFEISNGVSPQFDIGSGGQFTPVSAVPVPAAAWLFGSALFGLLGFTRRKKTALQNN